jgi:AcrR family transcriptional regulator
MDRKQKKSPPDAKNGHTGDRILDEAEILFARKGYHGVSIREITNAARCNLAAVNYHFGNKQNLYLEVFRSRWMPRAMQLNASFRKTLKSNAAITPSTVIQSLARAFLDGPLTDTERRRHHQLISGELAQPTEAFELMADQVLQPLFNNLLDDLQAAMPEETEDEQMALNAFSILAMVLYFNLARPFISRFTGYRIDDDFNTRVVDHIVDFSLNGLASSRREAAATRKEAHR